MLRCGSQHPDDPTRHCFRSTDFHADHVDDIDRWDNNDPGVQDEIARIKASAKPKRGSSAKKGLRAMAIAATKGRIEYLKEERKRSFHRFTQIEGMSAAASSEASHNFRLVFFLAMAEVATRQQFVSTNDAWDLLESRGFERAGHAQAAGTVGGSGKAAGLWTGTGRHTDNTSGNYHSSDKEVLIYQSAVLGKDFVSEVAPLVVDKVAELEAARQQKEEAEAARVSPDAASTGAGHGDETDTSISPEAPRIWGESA